MFRKKNHSEIPTDFSSFNFGCRLAKYMIYLQNEENLNDINKREEKVYVNNAFDGQDGDDSVSHLNNTKQKVQGNESEDFDNAVINKFRKEINTIVDKENSNQNATGDIPLSFEKNIKVEETTSGSYASTIPDNLDVNDKAVNKRLNGDYKLKDLQNPKTTCVYNSTFKRSLSFGDKPKRRETKKDRLENTSNDGAFNTPMFYTGTDKSSSADSAFSGDSWRLSLEEFTSKRQGSKRKHRKVSKQMRSYYKKQDELIDTFSEIREKSFYKSQDDLINQYEEIRLDLQDVMEAAETERKLRKKASNYAKATFAVNFMLLIIKVVAVVLSGSISLISSLVDSSVDLLSGVVIWVTTRAVKKTDRYCYPQGRTKLEPVSIVILAVIMSVASLQIIKESFTKIFGLIDNSQKPPIMDWSTIGIASATVVVKLVLFLLCRRVKHPTVQALALDHRNDVLSNFVAIVFGYLGSKQMQAQVDAPGLVYIDPIGAIVISIYIIVNWVITGWDQIKLLIGHTATAAFISKITWICVDHHKKIEKVDTVRAFHFGHNFLVEVDIVLAPEMTVQEAHDIAEPLQQKLERLTNVERAFVHIDYEVSHDPKSEHKVV